MTSRADGERAGIIKGLIIALAVLACAAGAALWWAWGKTYDLTLTAAQLQAKIDPKFPIEKRYLVLVVLRLTDPVVKLKEGSDRIGIAVKAMVSFEKSSCQGTAELSGGIHYDPATGQFSIVDARVERLDVDQLPPKYHAAALTVAGLAAKEYLDRYPVYTLQATDTKTSAAKLLLKSVRVENGSLVIRLGVGG